METKDISIITGMVVLFIISIGSIGYQVYDTEEELTCRTGDGWVILEEQSGVFKAQCQYKTKDWITAYCSSFRSTASYTRYGCNEITLVKIENTIEKEVYVENIIEVPLSGYTGSGLQYLCPPNGGKCVVIE